MLKSEVSDSKVVTTFYELRHHIRSAVTRNCKLPHVFFIFEKKVASCSEIITSLGTHFD